MSILRFNDYEIFIPIHHRYIEYTSGLRINLWTYFMTAPQHTKRNVHNRLAIDTSSTVERSLLLHHFLLFEYDLRKKSTLGSLNTYTHSLYIWILIHSSINKQLFFKERKKNVSDLNNTYTVIHQSQWNNITCNSISISSHRPV